MIILVAGSDTWRVEQDVSRLVTHFREKFDPDGYNILQASFVESYDELLQAVNSAPFLADRRLVVAQDILAQTEEVEISLLKIIELTASSTILVLESKINSEKITGLTSHLESLEDKVTVHLYDSVKKLDTATLQGLLGHYGITLSRSQQDELINSSPSLEYLHSLFASIASFEPSGVLSEEVWRRFFPQAEEKKVFDFVDALIRKDSMTSLSFLVDFSTQKSSLMPLWALLYTQLRKYYLLLRAGEDFSSVAKDLGVSMFEQNKIKSALRSNAAYIDRLYERYVSLEREGRKNQQGILEAVGNLVDLTFSS